MFLGIYQLMMDREMPDLPPAFNETESAVDGDQAVLERFYSLLTVPTKNQQLACHRNSHRQWSDDSIFSDCSLDFRDADSSINARDC